MFLNSIEIADALGVSVTGKDDIVFTGISTDTRTIEPGNLFVALKSENADGHDYVGAAIEKGAIGVVSEKALLEKCDSVFIVDNTTEAYGKIAGAWRKRFNIPVIGVTGSVGKTSTKEMLALTLSPLGKILKTEASQNNETGVPKALLQLTGEHKAAIVEMGMRGRGQIQYLCNIAAPTAGVITLIAENHIELLGSLEEIVDSKGELFDSLPENGTAFINADDKFYGRLASKPCGKIVTFAIDSPADYKAENIKYGDDSWTFEVNGQTVTIASPSRHDISNALTAYAVAVEHGVKPQDASAALLSYESAPMRMQIMKVDTWNGVILNDAYNAAPVSMKAALETLHRYSDGRRIAFLGDMRELGDYGVPAHIELGNVIKNLGGLDALYTVGDLAAHIAGAAKRFKTSGEAAEFVNTELSLQEGDTILVKGSRAMVMERIAKALQIKGKDNA